MTQPAQPPNRPATRSGLSVVLLLAGLASIATAAVMGYTQSRQQPLIVGAELVATPQVTDLETQKPDSTHTLKFKIANHGTSTASDIAVRTSCSCTVVLGCPRALDAGQSAEIEFTWHLPKNRGVQKSMIIVGD